MHVKRNIILLFDFETLFIVRWLSFLCVLLKCYILNTAILCINAYHISRRMRKKEKCTLKMSFCKRKYVFLFVLFGFSSHKLVVKPQKILKAPSKGSAVENIMSAPLALIFPTVIKCYFDILKIRTPVNSASLVVILNRANSFTKLCEVYAGSIGILFFVISKTYFFSFVMLASRSLNTFFLYFYLEDCTRYSGINNNNTSF